FGDDQAELARGEPLGELRELNIDDAPQLVTFQPPEHHDLVEAVDELRAEVAPQRFHRHLALELAALLLREIAALLDRGELGRPDVAREDHDGVAEVHGATLTVREPAVV